MSDPHDKQVGEIWVSTEIDGYEVSNFGRVRSWKPVRNYAKLPTEPRILKSKIDKDGYHVVALYGDKKYHKGVHTLVCRAFNGEPISQDLQVRHLDGSKNNNIPDNLIWGTCAENSQDRINHGTQIKGIEVNTCKLNPSDVLLIRSDKRKLVTISKDYDISVSLIYKIKSKEVWKHV